MGLVRGAAAFIVVMGLATPAAAQLAPDSDAVVETPEIVVEAPEIVVEAPDCDDPDAYFLAARQAAREAQAAKDFKLAAKWWDEALIASRCSAAPNPDREVVAIASLGLAQLQAGATRKAAINFNTALEALLMGEVEKGSASEANLAMVFAMREALASKTGKPPTSRLRIKSTRVPETDDIRRNWVRSNAILVRSPPGMKLCTPFLAAQPELVNFRKQPSFNASGAVVVRLGLADDGSVVSAAVAAAALEGDQFQLSEIGEPGAYRLKFSQQGCSLPREVLVSFRFQRGFLD